MAVVLYLMMTNGPNRTLKGFQVRAYEEWSGLCFAETKKPFGRRPGAGDHDDTDAEYTATSSGHPTPEAAIDFIKQMIDSPSTTR